MRSRRRPRLAASILWLGFASIAIPLQAEPVRQGVVIEEAGEGSALEDAGILPGDLFLSWTDGKGETGEVRTVFDWLWLRTEQAPRGTLRLRGERYGAALSLAVPSGPWDFRVRPWMDESALRTYEEGRRRIEAGDVEGGVSLWGQLVPSGGRQDLERWVLFETGRAWSNAGRGDKARDAWQAALKEAPDPQYPQAWVALEEALGESFQYAGEMAHAEAAFREALEIGEAVWGESLQGAASIARLGNVLRLQNRTDEAMELQCRALKIRQRLAPDSLEVADSLHQLFLGEAGRENMEEMADLSRRALAIQERWPPDTLAMADTLNDVAFLAMFHGYHHDGLVTLQRAVAILERRSPGSIPLASLLGRVGVADRRLGDMEAADEALRRALAIREKLAPGSLGTAAVLYNLGVVARERGDLAAAAELIQRGVDISEKAVPGGLFVAEGLSALGTVATLRGDLTEAWSLHSRSLAIYERLGQSSRIADGLEFLGTIAAARGDFSQALDLQQRALVIRERLSPGTIEEAQTLQQIGRVYRRTGHPDQAAQLFGRAVDALEAQVGRLAGSQDRQAELRASHEEIYHDAIEVELELGHTAEAFHLVERSRARSFLALLAERDLVLSGETSETGKAALRQSQPFDLAAARKALDPGTLALSYSVGKDRTALFAVTRDGGLRVEILPVGEESLRRDVERFLEAVRQPKAVPADLSRPLYRTLIGPVADLVERSERVLILPDGPLHRLPFGALVRDPGAGYLTEWKPLHTALSLTVYGTLRAAATASGSGGLVAFGDPRYPKTLQSNLSLGLRSFDWSALPYSRREVERIAESYPEAHLYLGEEATEERARSMTRDARVVHFATHGFTDDRTPLDSALVLTIPADQDRRDSDHRDDGLLQVWEIFESVRLDADLVVLSACESALGREQSGEGLIGLTRAFQYAGARSVVASLWNVADQVTAELMVRFHRHRAAGLPKDEALRAAQIELIRAPLRITTDSGRTIEIDASAPFFWAAFQLFGDRL